MKSFSDESSWIDLSPRHKETQEKLERRIREYKESVPHLPKAREQSSGSQVFMSS